MPEEVLPPDGPREEQGSEEPAPADEGSAGPDIPASVKTEAEAKVEEEGVWPPEIELTGDEKTMAMLAWLLGVFTWFVGPLVVYLVKREESKFVAFHALQSLYFQLASFAIVLVIAVVTCGFGSVLGLAPMVVDVIWCIKASNGEWAELPVIADWCKKK